MSGVIDHIAKVVQTMRGNVFDSTFDFTFDSSAVPYFMFGHRMEIAKRLSTMDKDSVFKSQKYPLIALRQDIPERMTSGGSWEYKLNIIMVTYASKTDNAEQRHNSTFKNILQPMYDSFMAKLRQSGMFMWPYAQEFPEHTKIDRPYYGIPTAEGNKANPFNDPTDAIEIIDLKLLQTTNKRCINYGMY